MHIRPDGRFARSRYINISVMAKLFPSKQSAIFTYFSLPGCWIGDFRQSISISHALKNSCHALTLAAFYFVLRLQKNTFFPCNFIEQQLYEMKFISVRQCFC